MAIAVEALQDILNKYIGKKVDVFNKKALYDLLVPSRNEGGHRECTIISAKNGIYKLRHEAASGAGNIQYIPITKIGSITIREQN